MVFMLPAAFDPQIASRLIPSLLTFDLNVTFSVMICADQHIYDYRFPLYYYLNFFFFLSTLHAKCGSQHGA